MNLIFREPADKNELESLFRLRHTVYSEDTSLHKMVSRHSTHDINWFDLNALHFAGFDGAKPIAYLRMATNSETHFSLSVKEIAAMNNIFLANIIFNVIRIN